MQHCDVKLEALKAFLIENRDELVSNAVACAKEICIDLGIVMQRRRRKRQLMAGEESQDNEISYEAEFRR